MPTASFTQISSTLWHSRDSRNSRNSKARLDLGQGELGMVWHGHHGWPPGEPAGQPQCEKRKVSLFQDVTRRITPPAFFMAWLERQCKHLLGHLHAGEISSEGLRFQMIVLEVLCAAVRPEGLTELTALAFTLLNKKKGRRSGGLEYLGGPCGTRDLPGPQ